ncbi:small GTP-binding protein [Pyrolobus fumarii 1A]|uniref:Small GTP-binding protein n=1 Tax=Pyrolobus fumarii (strain DSM 11204 / 1A) TaxID=694429 RepID=G0EEW4_PYRF1|nr:GTPase [Pyrolobus fumarii]AEM38078.1 small GTP-binding protein [Pyrolobus fumarii 1A]
MKENVGVQGRNAAKLDVNTVVRLFKETHIPSIEEVVERIGRRYRRLRPRRRGAKGLIEFELKRVELVYNILRSVFEKLAKLPPTKYMNEYHALLIKSIYGDAYDKAIERARYALRLLEQLWNDYRLLIVTAENPREAARLRKEAAGRMISVWRRYKKHVDVLIEVKNEIIKTHVVSENLPVIVVAGIPSAGKSTLIRRVSSAEPEIAAYPFTTKTIIVGKLRCPQLETYIVDTPGILDRPYEELNDIEKKAYVALRALADVIVFLVDVSPERILDVQQQYHILDQIHDTIAEPAGTDIIVVINKVDVKEEAALKEAVSNALARGLTVIEISALTGHGVDMLLQLACDKAFKHFIKRSNLYLEFEE